MYEDDDLLRTAQVAKLCNVKPLTVRNWIRDGKLPSILVNHRHLVRFEDVMRMLGRR